MGFECVGCVCWVDGSPKSDRASANDGLGKCECELRDRSASSGRETRTSRCKRSSALSPTLVRAGVGLRTEPNVWAVPCENFVVWMS